METWVIERARNEREVEHSVQGSSEGGRFVLHRHGDDGGEHLDLRLEEGDVLAGWRLPRDAMEHMALGDIVACELKLIHPTRWLDVNDEVCAVEDSGKYRWVVRNADRGVAVFEGQQLAGQYSFVRRQERAEPVLESYRNSRSVIKEELGLDLVRAEDVAQLLARARDGETARKRAIERLCALGRELDGESFDEKMWRNTLRHLSLAGIHAHLRSFEKRFDEKYPPLPVTKREKLEEGDRQREKVAAGILSEEFSLLE
ncbi:MAG: hypothetical protein KAJ01_10770 [Candidatus Hydrogenedentes bacterium]|nr:hypothetical protein [Candidatus Hydrogenedentota bacterium]